MAANSFCLLQIKDRAFYPSLLWADHWNMTSEPRCQAGLSQCRLCGGIASILSFASFVSPCFLLDIFFRFIFQFTDFSLQLCIICWHTHPLSSSFHSFYFPLLEFPSGSFFFSLVSSSLPQFSILSFISSKVASIIILIFDCDNPVSFSPTW